MTAKRTLRVATDADAQAVKPKTLSEAVESGTYLEILTAQRRQMIADLSNANGPALAALHRQIALHSKEIQAIQAAAKQEAFEDGDVDDESLTSEAL